MTKISFCKFLFILFNSMFVLLISCKSDKSKTKLNKTLNTQTLYENFVQFDESGVNYKIPSPMELFVFLKKTESPFLANNIHKIADCEKYISKKEMAINFGIYSADLAYCSVFGDFQQTLNYFNVAKQLANNLGLHEGFGQQMAHRINKNLNSIDSLMEISADSYYLANQFLEDQGKSDVLGLILIGGWIEGVYLAVESVDGVNVDNPVVERIADQQVLLENLLGYLHKNESSSNISESITDLEELQEVFDELYFNNENTLITKKQFVDISNGVKSLRNKYIN